MFHFVVPFLNAEKYLKTCIESIKAQTLTDWRCHMRDDGSRDASRSIGVELLKSDRRLTYGRYTHRLGVCGNYHRVINWSHKDAIADDDIIVCVDGDDQLSDSRVLERISKAYADPDVWITWGSYRTRKRRASGDVYHGHGIASGPVMNVTKVRESPWRTSHLRTFKAFLFRAVKHEDLKDDSGNYWQAGGDMAMMFPMLEMAGNHHARYLRDVNYIYTADNPLSDHRVWPEVQKEAERQLREKPAYQLLEL